ncbi:MAG: [protein-PII] uridylyltransferase [Desulfobacterales bacterium]
MQPQSKGRTMPSLSTSTIRPALSAAQRLEAGRRALLDQGLERPATDFIRANAGLIDEYLRESYEESLTGPTIDFIRNPYTMVALGGYGRQEQCLHSDVDLLILFHKKVPARAEGLIQEMVYPLWDLGLEVGYATRALRECLALARKDFEVLTSLLDARFICGASPLFSDLKLALRQKILSRQAAKVVNWLVDRNLARHRQHGDSSYLLEPNLKEGQGGLRDYHTILWIGKIKYNFTQRRDLEFNGLFSHEEYGELCRATEFIWNTRNHLHRLTGRKCDQIYLEHQIKLSAEMGYTPSEGLRPVENFLSELHRNMELIKEKHLMFLHEFGPLKRILPGRRPPMKSRYGGLVADQRTLAFAAAEQIVADPALLMLIFEESARLKLPLGTEAKRLIREFSHLVDDRFRGDPLVVKSFERILSVPSPVFDVLNAMLQTGFLAAFIPEFAAILNRIQYNEYHIFPVARHAIRTVQAIQKLGLAKDDDPQFDPLYQDLYKALPSRKRLLWAGLLHDIGKGVPGDDHSASGAKLAYTILTRMGLALKDIEIICAMVAQHLDLIKTATRRDLNDEETALACAGRVGTLERLQILYLLTVADSMATGPKAWNQWNAAMLRELFIKVHNFLKTGELTHPKTVRKVQGKKEQVTAALAGSDLAATAAEVIPAMAPRYLMAMPVAQMQRHITLFSRMGETEFAWEIETGKETDTRTVTVCAKDRPGLFAKIAGVLTLNSVNILDAQVFTWRNRIALDIFHVAPPPDPMFEDERWQRAQNHLHLALNGQLDLKAAVAAKRTGNGSRTRRAPAAPHMPLSEVRIDNQSSSFFTILEIISDDYPGLLFDVTTTIYEMGLDIWVSKITTVVDQVMDIFYVRDFDGQKITEEAHTANIRNILLEILPKR